jgi:nicotinamidase-related amidase
MMDRIGREELLELVLARRPDRVIDALGAHPADAADLALLRGALADLASAVAPVEPSSALRARLLSAPPRPRRPVRPVVVVLDMLNDHLEPGRPLEVPRARAIVPALAARLAEARRNAIPIVYACDRHPPGDAELDVWPTHAVEGTSGAEVWPALAPEPGDRVVPKPTYSAFASSELGAALDELGADEIILTGCMTEVGIQATAVDALQRGFVVQIPFDCQAGMSEMTEMATLLTLGTLLPYDPIYMRKRPAESADSPRP